MIYHNGRMIPYIMVEIKAFGSPLEPAIEQLKSYMSVTKECAYGVVCNGNDFYVCNSKFEEQGDIPSFQLSMQASSTETFQFVHLSRGTSINYFVDGKYNKEIITDGQNGEERYKAEELITIPVYSYIAAGEPVLILEEVEDSIKLPINWLSNPDSCFALIVKGDSMKEANILDQDIIIIRSQNTADNGQIVAVDLDGSTTLKRLRRMGGWCVYFLKIQSMSQSL